MSPLLAAHKNGENQRLLSSHETSRRCADESEMHGGPGHFTTKIIALRGNQRKDQNK
jgi:hypothetical protein